MLEDVLKSTKIIYHIKNIELLSKHLFWDTPLKNVDVEKNILLLAFKTNKDDIIEAQALSILTN